MELILAEELLLLFLEDERGTDRTNWGGDPGLAGAPLLEIPRRPGSRRRAPSPSPSARCASGSGPC